MLFGQIELELVICSRFPLVRTQADYLCRPVCRYSNRVEVGTLTFTFKEVGTLLK